MRIVLTLLIGLAISVAAEPRDTSAQVRDTVATLPEIRIEATRAVEVEAAAPMAVTVLAPEDFRTSAAHSLQDIASRAPGLWLADRGHFALGERVVIRGVGSRSPFGVRGIQVLYDGIPLTMPDGQAVTDMIDPFMVRRVELLRGPSSVYWGNASGGTLSFSTESGDERLLRVSTGSYGRRYVGGRTTVGSGENQANVFLSHTVQDGFRAHSDGYMTRGGLTARVGLGDAYQLRIVASGALQDVNSPGSLTAAEYAADPYAANQSYVNTASGKWSQHLQGGAVLSHRGTASRLDIAAYGVLRDLENPLPFAFIEVGRLAGGARATYSRTLGRSELILGVDAGRQADERRNYQNVDGRRGDSVTLDQMETVTAVGASAFLRMEPAPRIRTTVGARIDRLHYDMNDRLGDGVDRSGSRTFAAVSPSLSAAYLIDGGHVYASLSTSFETPTTTELVNNPDMSSGFNPDLTPERTVGIESGVRYAFGRMSLDAAVFAADIDGRISSYRTEAGGDRDFFRNAARGRHVGGEAALSIRLPEDLHAHVSYAALRATTTEESVSTTLPAVPPHQLFAELTWSPSNLRLGASVDAASSYFADDANTHRIDGFAVADVFAAYSALPIAGANVSPFVRMANVFDRQYVRSIVVNASFSRFYEPSPGRTFEAGVTVDL